MLNHFILPLFIFPLIVIIPRIALQSQSGTSFPEVIVEPAEILPSDRIPGATFIRNRYDFILCRGKNFKGDPPSDPGSSIIWQGKTYNNFGTWNNELVSRITPIAFLNRKLMILLLKKFRVGLKSDPLFFPFLYNTGRIYLLIKRPREAIRYFRRARGVMSQYTGIYMNLGFAYARIQDERATISSFRRAARLNPFNLKPLIALGNYFLERKSAIKAGFYFQRVLEKKPYHSNAQIGLARLYIHKGDLIKARILLKQIPTEKLDGTPRTDYDRSLHYFLAALAAQLRDYQEALKEYNKMLSFPKDPFFLSTSFKEIERRRNIVKRLAESRGGKLE